MTSDDDLPEFEVTPGMMVVIGEHSNARLATVREVGDGWVRVNEGFRVHVDDIRAVALYRDQADFVFGGDAGATVRARSAGKNPWGDFGQWGGKA